MLLAAYLYARQKKAMNGIDSSNVSSASAIIYIFVENSRSSFIVWQLYFVVGLLLAVFTKVFFFFFWVNTDRLGAVKRIVVQINKSQSC